MAASSEPESPASARGTTAGKSRGKGRSTEGKGGKGRKGLRQGQKTKHRAPSVHESDEACTSSEPPSSPEAARIRNAQAKFEARLKPRHKKCKTSANPVEEFRELQCAEDGKPTALLDFLKIATSHLTPAELERMQKIDISYAEFHAGMGSGSIALVRQLV